MDAIEVNGNYYLLTDLITTHSYRSRIPTITICDESLNIVKKIELFDSIVKIQPVKLFYNDNFFYLTGLCDKDGYGKPFLIKFDMDFNMIQPLISYNLKDSSDYGWGHVIMNKTHEFMYVLYATDFSHNYLLHIGNDGTLRQEVSFSGGFYKASIAEINNHYYIDIGRDFLLKWSENFPTKIDTLPVILHEDDNPEGTLIAIGEQLIQSNTSYVFRDECGEYPPLERDRSIVFLDTNMEAKNRLVFGNPCINDADAYWNMSYINPDSIYYVYLSSNNSFQEAISIANFSQDGHLNFNNMLNIQEDSLFKVIYGCKAVSDGGVLVFGTNLAKGFFLKYHPQRNDLILNEFPIDESIKIYPNPAQTQFTVTNTENTTIHLYNILGQKVKQVTRTEENTIIQTKDLSAGMYVLKVEKENALFTKKVQIIR